MASLSVNLTTMLVLCQMVPFAEVVLLTAMEYHRVDKRKVGRKKNRRRIQKKKSKSIRPTVLNVEPMDREGRSADTIDFSKSRGGRGENFNPTVHA